MLRAQPREWLFCCAFWLCQTIPVTVILFYSPIILSDVTGSADQTGRVALIYTLFMIGTLPMTLLKRTINPAKVLVVTAVVMAASLAGVALFGKFSPMLLSLFFGAYAFSYSRSTRCFSPAPALPSAARSASGFFLPAAIDLFPDFATFFSS